MARTGVRLTSPETYTTIWNMISNIDHRLPRWLTLLCAAAQVSGSPGANQKTRASQRYAVIVAPLADPLELYAASELRKYLRALYGLDPALANSPDAESDGFFLIGNPRTNPETDAVAGATWPKVSDQGMVFRKAKLRGKPAFLLGGGSSQATLWAVYEFVQRAGVRFLLEKDVLPMRRAPFPPVQADFIQEPQLRFRSYRGVNDLATSWFFMG
jgi:hypothetical protein